MVRVASVELYQSLEDIGKEAVNGGEPDLRVEAVVRRRPRVVD